MFDLSVDKFLLRQAAKPSGRVDKKICLACLVGYDRKPNSFFCFNDIKINPSVQFQSARLGFIFFLFLPKVFI